MMNVQFGAKVTGPTQQAVVRRGAKKVFGDEPNPKATLYKGTYNETAQDLAAFRSYAARHPGVHQAYFMLANLPQESHESAIASIPKTENNAGVSAQNRAVSLNKKTVMLSVRLDSTSLDDGVSRSESGALALGSEERDTVANAIEIVFNLQSVGEHTHVYALSSIEYFHRDSENFRTFAEKQKPGLHTAYYLVLDGGTRFRETFTELVNLSRRTDGFFEGEFREKDDVMVLRMVVDTALPSVSQVAVLEGVDPKMLKFLKGSTPNPKKKK